MNGISLNFKDKKYEQQFNKVITKSGKEFSNGYLIFLCIEAIVIGIDYAVNGHQRDLVILYITAAQIVLGWSPSYYNVFVAVQNLSQGLINCILIRIWLDSKDSYYVNNFSYCVNIILKHIYLLQGSSFTIKFFTLINLCLLYLVFFLDKDAGLRHFIFSLVIVTVMHIYKIFQEDISIRNIFLEERSEDQMNVLLKRLLPISMLITKYNKDEERVHFHVSNTKLQNQFQIKDDESMNNLFMNMQISKYDDNQQNVQDNNTNLFQYLNQKSKQLSIKDPPNIQIKIIKNDSYVGEQDQRAQQNNSLNNQKGEIFSAIALNQKDDLISPGTFTQRQSDNLLSQRQQIESNGNQKQHGLGYNNDVNKQKNSFSNRENNNYEKQFDQNIHENYAVNNINSDNFNLNNPNKNQFQINDNINKSTFNKIYDCIDRFNGVIYGNPQKIFNIRVYTYILDEIYQIIYIRIYNNIIFNKYQLILFDDEHFQGKTENNQNLNQYYSSLFNSMLMQIRIPIAQNLYQIKKTEKKEKSEKIVRTERTEKTYKQSSLITRDQQSTTQFLTYQDSIMFVDPQVNPLYRISNILSEVNIKKSSGNDFQIYQSTNIATQLEDVAKEEEQNKELANIVAQDIYYCNYFVLNKIFNYQDILKLITNTQIVINPINLQIERIINDLKNIFLTEYKLRQLDLIFINDLQDEESQINTDEKYFKQVLINLISNSMQSLSRIQKGFTNVSFKKNLQNRQVIEVCIMDSGPGFDNSYNSIEQAIILEPSLCKMDKNIDDLKIGIPISQKIIGKLGPYEKVIIEKNTVKFLIFKDYQSISNSKYQ